MPRPIVSPRERIGAVTGLTVSGYKSLDVETRVEVRPLTILAGPNSSGKSSIMQPLLLLKQTLEETFDPGPLQLDGRNVRFTSPEQLLSRTSDGGSAARFSVGVEFSGGASFTLVFAKAPKGGFAVDEMAWRRSPEDEVTILRPGMSGEELRALLLSQTGWLNGEMPKWKLSVKQSRCFLEIALTGKGEELPPGVSLSWRFVEPLRAIVHISGARGNPERAYPRTGVSFFFPGTFERYVASVVDHWQEAGEERKLRALKRDLRRLGLTADISASRIADTQIELQVGRVSRACKERAADKVNIVDVGFGVSQVLPVLVAMQVAEPQQLVYVEQPEIHLHPRAQVALAGVLAAAAKRGVRVVAETHSDLLIVGIQALVAEGKLPAGLVKLHWFSQRPNGATRITSRDMDEDGSFGDWPEDFTEVSLRAQSRYLNAADRRKK